MDEETKEKIYEALMNAGDLHASKIERCIDDIEITGSTFYKKEIKTIIRISEKNNCLYYITLMDGKLTWVIH